MSLLIGGALIWRKLATSILPQIASVAIKHWKITLIIILLAIIYNQNHMTFQVFRIFGIETIPHIKEEWQQTQEELDICTQNKLALESAIDSLNAEIDRWAIVSGNLQQSHNALVSELNTMGQQTDQNVNDILAGEAPATCESAIDYLRDAAGVLK